ncbi:hypothetical protein K440DRAFT_366972 [Wilcoxina mikolae CBS 423.85]|nr:hypothetical protein K440DRAFT_366972 [Wilcoxina mikolae CBS 423.85]
MPLRPPSPVPPRPPPPSSIRTADFHNHYLYQYTAGKLAWRTEMSWLACANVVSLCVSFLSLSSSCATLVPYVRKAYSPLLFLFFFIILLLWGTAVHLFGYFGHFSIWPDT